MEVKIDAEALAKFEKKLRGSSKVMAEAKRRAFRDAAPKLKQAVDSAIGGSGKVASWQADDVGSLGGYAAVRPKAKTFTPVNRRGKRYAVGHVTNAIDQGHKFPTPSGKDPNYRPRIESTHMKVPGRQFYKAAEAEVPEIAKAAAQQVVDELREHFEE